MDYPFDDKDWDDYPVRYHCGTCVYFQNDTCVNPSGNRYDEHVHESYDACGEWEDGQ